jgi:hypothetical protein
MIVIVLQRGRMGSAHAEPIAFPDVGDGYRYVQPILQKRRCLIA